MIDPQLLRDDPEAVRRSQESRAMPGSGLGLALVAEHATRLGGSMRIEERSGGGARFVLRFPFRAVA